MGWFYGVIQLVQSQIFWCHNFHEFYNVSITLSACDKSSWLR